MLAIAEYLFKVVLISLILYSYYHVLLRNRLMHNWNRSFLLGIFVVSICIPFISLPDFFAPVQSFQPLLPVAFVSEGTNISFIADDAMQRTIRPQQVILFVYVVICMLFAGSLLMSFFRLTWWRFNAPKVKINGIAVVDVQVKRTPFSFFRCIFWNNKIDINSAEGRQILQHEMVHVYQLHSLDRLAVNLLMIVFWINPVFWLVRKELFMVHEFIADEQSVENRDADEFARMLLKAAFPLQYKTLTSHFFTSPIKRRLHMLTQQQKTHFGMFIRLFTLPLLLLLIAAFSISDRSVLKKPSNIVDTPATDYVPAAGNSILQDTLKASFPGGEKAWQKYISKEVVKHIDSLQEAGKTGTTVVTFVVHENGTLSDLKTTQMEGTLFAKIIFDAIKNGPKWVPATSNGEKVRSIYKQPATFQISND